jgi:hypothetical protein
MQAPFSGDFGSIPKALVALEPAYPMACCHVHKSPKNAQKPETILFLPFTAP